MKVKHLDELYTWRQIRKLQLIHSFNQHNGFVPVAIYHGENSDLNARFDLINKAGGKYFSEIVPDFYEDD